ncbi:GrpB family protein [Micromonospora sp. NPDC050695]|uniref:GrpB family protein n=1 Tax=Micromonospora sp. NPDC050695 TaxID=3154938 RepID=UPI0033DA74E9
MAHPTSGARNGRVRPHRSSCRSLADFAAQGGRHVWPQGAPEPVRHRLFRDWLRSHPAVRERYAATKRRLARETAHRPRDYSLAKNDVIDEIYARIFAACDVATDC